MDRGQFEGSHGEEPAVGGGTRRTSGLVASIWTNLPRKAQNLLEESHIPAGLRAPWGAQGTLGEH